MCSSVYSIGSDINISNDIQKLLFHIVFVVVLSQNSSFKRNFVSKLFSVQYLFSTLLCQRFTSTSHKSLVS